MGIMLSSSGQLFAKKKTSKCNFNLSFSMTESSNNLHAVIISTLF